MEAIQEYCELCKLPESRETLEARYRIILTQREEAHRRVQEAMDTAQYMDEKVRHYEAILAGELPDDTNPDHWTAENRPARHHDVKNGSIIKRSCSSLK